MKNNNAFAEVIESSLTTWLCQSWQWDAFPKFGSLVSIEQNDRTIIGIVHQVQTGSMDPMRYPFAYQKTEEELRAEQPQIFEFLKTTFNCLAVGHAHKNNIFYTLPPEPPKIHTFVHPIDTKLAQKFFKNNQYLHVLFANASTIGHLDELLLTLLSYMTTNNMLDQEKLHEFIETVSLLTGNDYRRLKLFLQRAETVCSFKAHSP